MPPPKYIAIDGPIGVGKTTLVKRVAEELKGTTILEPVEENPFLDEFYKDRKRNAFKTQLFFLLSRYQQQRQLISSFPRASLPRRSSRFGCEDWTRDPKYHRLAGGKLPSEQSEREGEAPSGFAGGGGDASPYNRQEQVHFPLVCDYTFAKDRIFAKINLNEAEQELYQKVHGLLHEELPKPDIVVYLRAKPEVLLSRIKQRGHLYEKSITENYLEALMEAYNECFLNYNETPLLVVDTTHTDFLKHHDEYERIKNEILHHRQGSKQLILR